SPLPKFSRITGVLPWKLLSPGKTAGRRERSAESGTDSFAHSRDRVSILKSGRARARHEFSGPERFVLAIITVELPAAQTAAGVHNFPARAAEDALDFGCRSFEHKTTMQVRLRFRCCGKARDQCSAATTRSGRKAVRATVIVTNVVMSVNRRDDSTVAFLLHRTNK